MKELLKRLARLLKKTRPPMTDAELIAQRRSFAYGNVKMHNDDVTREDIAKAAENADRQRIED